MSLVCIRACCGDVRVGVGGCRREAKATRGDTAARSSSSPSAGAPARLRTSSPASGTSPSSCGRTGPWACLE